MAGKERSSSSKSSNPLREMFELICAKQPTALPERYENKNETSSWSIGRRKVFATWKLKGEQIGPHLRSNDPAVRSDSARVQPTSTPSRRMEKTNNFVWLDPSAKWTEQEIEVLVAASHVLSMRKDGGIKRGGEFADLFVAVRKSLTAAPSEMRPPPPYHAGGPAAKILGNETTASRALAQWAAKLLTPFVPASEKELFDKRVNADAHKISGTQFSKLYYEKTGSRALTAARAALLAGRASDTRASSYATEVVCALLEELVAAAREKRDGQTTATVRAFLEEVDDRVLNAEFGAVAASKLGKYDVDNIERVLWRGSDATGNANRWLARLAKDRYALIAKVDANWKWLEGTRDDVFANISDDVLASATEIAFKRDEKPGAFGVGAIVPHPMWERRAAKKKTQRKR